MLRICTFTPKSFTYMTAFVELLKYTPTRRKYTTLLSEFVYAMYLFIKSDIKTTLTPIVSTSYNIPDIYLHVYEKTIFGLVNAPNPTLSQALPVIFWVFLHLLQCDISNQYLPSSIIEDTENKPYRPIPSGRVTVKRATQLRWALVPLCLALSGLYGAQVVYMSAVFLCMTAAYNELNGSAFWLTRDTINGTGFAGLLAAAILVVNPDHKLNNTNIAAVLFSAATFATTNFAQDFKDVIGDKLAKRNTIPVVFPQGFARVTLAVLVLGWTAILSTFWALPLVVKTVYFSLALTIGVRFICLRSLESDRTTYYYLYNVSALFLLPMIFAEVRPLS